MVNTSTLEEMLQEPKERRGGGNTNTDLKATLETPGFGGRHDFDSLFPEVQVQIFELVVVSAWKDGLQITPSAVEMSTYPGRRLDDGHGAVGGQVDNTDAGAGRLDISYPKILLLVCTRWQTIVQGTASLWSYLSITDDSSLGGISLSLQRSKSFPLSLRVRVLSEISSFDWLQIGLRRTKKTLGRLGVIPQARLDSFANGALGTRSLNAFVPFENKISLLLEHISRWQLFQLFATQPQFVHHAMARIAELECGTPLLREFCIQVSTSTSSRDFDPKHLATVTQKSLPFESALPSLQRLSLCYGILPVGLQFLRGLTPSFLPCTLPGLEELELSNDVQLDHSLWLYILHALPLLRVLKLNSIKFKQGVPISGVADIPRNVVLEELGELTLQAIDQETLANILGLLAVPNLQLLSCIAVQGFDSVIGVIQDKNIFFNVRKLSFQSMKTNFHDEWLWKLYSSTPEVTSIHFDWVSQSFAMPLVWQCPKLPGSRILVPSNELLLPVLTEVSVSLTDDRHRRTGAGDKIVELVKARRDKGVPIKSVRIDKSSILFGIISHEEWEALRGLVETVRWYDKGDNVQKL